MQQTQSRRYRERLEDAYSKPDEKCRTRGDAACWGRLAAVLNWGLSELANEVEPEFHEIARAAYNRRMLQLYGAPF